MLKKIIFLWVIFFATMSCSKEDDNIVTTNQNQDKYLINTIGGSQNDVAISITATIDGGYAITGYTLSTDFDIKDKASSDNADYFVSKFNKEGEVQWTKTFGGSLDERANAIIQTNDTGFAVLGYSTSSDLDVSKNNGSKDFWLLKLDANGNQIWSKNFGFSGSDFGTTLLQTKDNGFLITGVLDVTASGGLGNAKVSAVKHAGGDIWAIKLYANGNLEWSKYYGGSFLDTPFGVVETTDNHYIIAGSSDSNDVDISNNKGFYDFWVIKISAIGNLVWEKSFGGSEIDEARAITATHDGNFLIVGDTRSSDKDVANNNGAADIWLTKINTNGDLIWEKTIGGSSFDVARSIFKTYDGNFVLTGSSRSIDYRFNNKGQNDALLLKINSEGNLIWQKNFGGKNFDFCYGVTQITDGTIVAVGETRSTDGDIINHKGFADALIIKYKEK